VCCASVWRTEGYDPSLTYPSGYDLRNDDRSRRELDAADARNLLGPESGFIRDKKHLIVDRDSKHSTAFRHSLDREGVGVIQLPPRSPNMNAYAEGSGAPSDP